MSAVATVTRFVPSPYQRAVFNFIINSRRSAIVKAVAGAGKTKTIERSLPLIPERCHVLLLAFNRTIAAELKERIEGLRKEFNRPFVNFEAKTFHALCYNVVRKHLNLPFELAADDRKLNRLCRDWLGDYDYELYASYICELVGLAKGEGIGALVPDTEDRWWDLAHHHDLHLDSEDANETTAVRLARQLLQLSTAKARDGIIDYDDLLYLTCLWKLRVWRRDYIFVDESQDTNPVRRAIVRMALQPGGRVIAVGDPRQAIYGFTGASHDAMDQIKQDFNCVELPLTVSYRCGRKIVEAARHYVDYIEPAEGAIEGRVEWLKLETALRVLQPTDAVLCRNTAPLIDLAYKLTAQRRPCRVLGREIGTGLVKLIKSMQAKTIDGLVVKLAEYKEREVQLLLARKEEQKIEGLLDRVASIELIVKNLGENQRTVLKLIKAVEELFGEAAQAGCLTLCTVHKAKGSEWDRVAVLKPELMPSKWARQEWQQLQEENLIYVCYTRAREHLIFLTSEQEEAQP